MVINDDKVAYIGPYHFFVFLLWFGGIHREFSIKLI